jgi:hypothetical protein
LPCCGRINTISFHNFVTFMRVLKRVSDKFQRLRMTATKLHFWNFWINHVIAFA